MTSMNQWHTAPYRADMHWRVVWKRFSKQQTFLDKSFEIAPNTAHRIFTDFIERGDVDPKGKRGPKKLDDYMEMHHRLDIGNPFSAFERAMRESRCVSVSEATLLYSHGFTRKKIRQVAQLI